MSRKLIVVCAPSGAGKTTIVKHVLAHVPNVEFSVSATNRPQRDGEENGRDYYFMDTESFQQKIAEDAFLEWEEVYPGRYYGTLKSEVERIGHQGKFVIFDVDVEGGLNIKRYYGNEALMVFIKPPSVQHLKNRLETRATESPESLKARIDKAEIELSYEQYADAVIVNDSLEEALKNAEEIILGFLRS